ncbi:MAG TPA: IS110 family transposase [Pyrinomonadaceae bacterium]|jgi:transposase|nr:IS110 family transposase [Pyrinomonadaceae bacterium]
MSEYAALVSIDWADQKHAVCLLDPNTGKREQAIVQHTPQALQEWALSLRQRFAGQPIAVCLEQARGPLIYALLQYDFFVLYPINPATLAKYRQAFSTAHGKDDPTDADYLLDLLEHHRKRLRSWKPDDEKTRTLRLLVEQRRRLVSDRTRFSNRLTALLKGYFPQVLDWFEDIRTRLVCDFLERWPELTRLQQARPATINKFLRSHHSTSKPTNQRRLSEIKSAIPLTTDEAVITSSVINVKVLVAQMKTVIAAISEYDRHLEALCQTHDDYHLFAALPGAGAIHAARLTAALGSDRSRWPSADELVRFSGIAPIIERSGKLFRIRWRYFCPKFFRQTFHEFAAQSIQDSFWARAYYSSQRAKGKDHHAAVRALAFKWMRIIWKCWQTRTPYNEVIYLESLRKKGSSLLKFAADHQA